MKYSKVIGSYLHVIVLPILAAFCLHLSSCGDREPKPTAGEKAITALTTSVWKIKSVTVDGIDQLPLFAGYAIAFTRSSQNGGSYSTNNGGVVWPPSGQWTIVDINMPNAFMRNDGLEVQLDEVTDLTLKMSLQWNKNTYSSGRVESIKGKHVFIMGR